MYPLRSLYLLLSVLGLGSSFYNHQYSGSGGFMKVHNPFHHGDEGQVPKARVIHLKVPTHNQNGGMNSFEHNHGCDHGSTNPQQQNPNKNEVRTLTPTQVIQNFNDAHKALMKLCNDLSNLKPIISYGTSGCVLTYTLPGTGQPNIEVTIKNNVLETSVNYTGQTPGVFTDIRVLPDILNFNGAAKSVSDGKLRIKIPYRVPLETESSGECGAVYANVTVVPTSLVPAFQYRINKD